MVRLRTALAMLLVLAGVVPAAAQYSVTNNNPVNFGTWSIGQVEVLFSATGGTGGPYTYTILDPANLPPGTSLRSDMPSFASPSQTAAVSGIVSVPGTYTFLVQVSDGVLTTVHTTTVKVTALTFKDLFSLPVAAAGQPYSFTFTALNNAGPLTWTANAPLPAGLTLSPSGVLSGTPSAIPGTSAPISVLVSDGTDTVGRGFSLPIDPFAVTSDLLLPNARVGQPYSALITVAGGTPPFSFSAPGLPAGLSINSQTGSITGTPTQGNGRFTFVVTISDSGGRVVTKVPAIYFVNSPVSLPTVGPLSGRIEDCTVGTTCNWGATVFTGGQAPFTWSASGLPPGMSIRQGAGSSQAITGGDAEIWGTPTAAGIFNVQLTVTDAAGQSATNVFPYAVGELMQTDFPTVAAIVGQSYSRRLRVIGGTGTYTATLDSGSLPAGLSLDSATQTIAGTPIESGNFSFIVKFTDGANRQLRRFNSLVVNQPAGGGSTISVNSSDLGSVKVGDPVSITLSACCLPTIQWSTVAGSSLPPGLSLSATGQLTGSVGVAGTYFFLVKAFDSTNPSNASQRQLKLVATPFSISVSSPTGTINGNVGTVLTITFQSNPATPLTYAFAATSFGPPGLSFVGNQLTGTPSFSGQFGFSVVGKDGAGNTATAPVTVFIYPAGVFPPLNLTISSSLTLSLGQQTLQLSATGGNGVYHYSLTPGAEVVPGMRVQDGAPLPTNFPANVTGGYLGVITTPGVYHTSIRVTDTTGAFFDKPVTVTVPSLGIATQFTAPKGTIGVPYTFSLGAVGGSGNYSWASTSSLPAGLAFNAVAGQITGTPTTAVTMTPSFTVTDTTTGETLGTSVSLTIDPWPIQTNGALPPAAVNAPYSMTFSAPACPSPCVWSISGAPGGLSLVSSTGVLSGTPTAVATVNFSVTATGGGKAVTKLFSLIVTPNPAGSLAISTTSIPTTIVGGQPANQLNATGGVPPYTWAKIAGTLPPGISLVAPGEQFGATLAPGNTYLTGRALQSGSYGFTLQVTDSLGATATRAYSWDVLALASLYNSLPLANTTLTYNQAYTQPLLVIGGTSHYTWSATLPTGLVLNATTGVVSGAPQNTGSYTVPVTISDDAGHTLTQSITFNIASAGGGPTITFGLGTSLSAQLGGTPAFNLSPTGGTAPYTISVAPGSSLPPGFAILTGNSVLSNGSPGTSYFLSGVPMATGTFSVTLIAQDSSALPITGARTFTVTVLPTAIFTNAALADGSVGTAYAQSLVAFDATGPLTWSVSPTTPLPPGLTLSAAGLLSGTPTTPGSFAFTITASNGTASNSATFTLKVSSLAITGPGILPAAVATLPYSYQLTATGAPNIVWSVSGLPSGLTASSSGLISGTPDSVVGSLTQLAVTASSGANSVLRRLSLPIRLQNPPPPGVSLTQTALADVTAGQNFGIVLNSSGGVAPLTWTVAPGSTLPAGATLLSGTQQQPGTSPGNTSVAGSIATPGDYTFALICTDALGAQSQRTFTLHVTPLALIGQAIFRNPTAGAAYAQQLTAVGGTGPYTFSALPTPSSAIPDALPPGMTLSSGGLLSGTTVSTGAYSFVVRILDSAGHTLNRTVTFIVASASGLRVNATPFNTSAGLGVSQLLTATPNAGLPSTYAWSVVGGALPPGLVIGTPAPGQSNITGQATTPGSYTFTLRATDTANAAVTADKVLTVGVSAMHFETPAIRLFRAENLPPATVGAAYSTRLKVSGGVAPRTFVVGPSTPLPIGLSLSSDGVLSGVPTQPGLYAIAVNVTDATGDTYKAPAVLILVTPAGTPPAMNLVGGDEIGELSVGVPFRFPLHLVYGGTGHVTWSVDAGTSLPPGLAIIPGTNGIPDLLAGTPTTAGRYVFGLHVTDATGQVIAVPADLDVRPIGAEPAAPDGVVGMPYSFALNPTGGVAPYTVQLLQDMDLPPGLALVGDVLYGTPQQAGSFQVGVHITDAAANSVFTLYQITIDNAAGDAPAVRLAPDPLVVSYTQTFGDPGPIPVSVQSSSVPMAYSVAVAGVPGATLTATGGTTPAGIAVDFHLTSQAQGTYSGTLAMRSNGSGNLFDIIPITVNILPAPPCTYSAAPDSGSVAAAGGSGSFVLNTGPSCGWTVSAPDAWTTITSPTSGTGTATIAFTVAANGGISARSTTITAGTASYNLTQFGSSCSFAITPSALAAPAAGGSATVGISASASGCGWSASSASGLGPTPASGTGNGSVNVTIPANATLGGRVLTATIAGQTFTVNQAGVECAVTLGAPAAAFGDAGGTSSFSVTTGAACQYDTTSAPSWVNVTGGGSGTGPGLLAYKVDANSSTSPRSGAIIVSGQSFLVNQAAAACSVTLDTSALGSPLPSGGGTVGIGVMTNGANCGWTASSAAAWAGVAPNGATGSGTVLVTAGANGSTASRTTSVTIGGQTVTINQAGTACSFSLQSANGAVPGGGGSGAAGLITAPGCPWTATSNTPAWLGVSPANGTGSGDVSFTATANPAATSRVGTLTIAGLTYTITQAAAACSFTLSAVPTSVSADGVTDATFPISTATAGCTPAPVSFVSWISVTGVSFAGTSGTVTYSVAPNTTSSARSGTIQVGDQAFVVNQLAASCGYSLAQYGESFTQAGGNSAVLGSPSALGCTPSTSTDQAAIVTLSPLTGPVNNIFTLPFTLAPYSSSLTGSIRTARIFFGGQIFFIKQLSW